MKMKLIAKGLLTYIPGTQVLKEIVSHLPGGEQLVGKRMHGGTSYAHYCYDVWLKHLTHLWQNGMHQMPTTLAELGPGDSLGIGIAAMLSGVDHYVALDVVRHSNLKNNLRVLDELVAMFKSRAPRPAKGWPDYDQYLDDKLFPGHILTDDVLKRSLDDQRIEAIRAALKSSQGKSDGLSIRYLVPWSDESVIEQASVDVITSHSTLEHVVDVEHTYHALCSWLKPGGTMTHQIDFKAHGSSAKWNGYRSYTEFEWKLILGKRPFWINRQPLSVHLKNMQSNGLEVICALTNLRDNGIKRTQLAEQWKAISDEDLRCAGAFVQAKKPH